MPNSKIIYKSYIKDFKSNLNNAEKKGVTEAGLLMKNKLKERLSHHGSGKKYKRGNKIHVASKKGEPPAPDFGMLRRSIQMEIYKSAIGWVAKVGSDLLYGLILERGRHGVGKRPWFKVTFKENEGAVEQILAENLIKGMR